MDRTLEDCIKDFVVEFEALYKECFNEDGSVKACGRDACKKLIKFLNRNSTDRYGDEEKGYMNVTLINELHNAMKDDLHNAMKVEGSV